MPTTVDTIEAAIDQALAPGFRGRLLAQGQARAMIWRDGQLPVGAPRFSDKLSYDLYSYGYSLLNLGLRLRDLGGDSERAKRAFEQAGEALEAVIARGLPNERDRDFHFIIAAAAYHLARLSARSYSLLALVQNDENFSPVEKALANLMLRNLDELEAFILTNRINDSSTDARLRSEFERHWREFGDSSDTPDEDNSLFFHGVDIAITDNFFGAIATFLLALERGERALKDEAIAQLRNGMYVCDDLSMLPQWWAHKIATHLVDDLWESSFHEKLPSVPSGGASAEWADLRELFICVLLRRSKAEIDLWPSQIAAAARSVDQADDLVVSLPTSAGKTRIAELCILRCLAARKRVVFVTPLRALSAQTEIALQRTFGPLGKSISALYGSIGVSDFDEDIIRERNIVVATPEKLDFALRNDPSLLDDVGLLIFDEGHMIGLSEREVRYEVQIQRLLKRPDASDRRIVCLSAILPDGNQLDDFANWLRRDQPGGLIKSQWRPTRLRYGEVIWNPTTSTALLNLRVGQERPFVPRFLTGVIPPVGRRTTIFPRDLGELCVASAWRLVADGQTVLVFCPVRRHVEPFAARIVKLHASGAIASLLAVDESVLQTAITLGQEWLGADHPILKCLRLGVAIHHGALPTAFRKEIERLLREGVLKVTISSPTLAQGLNLSATVVIIHSLFRNKERIETSEFKNVVGRAGRAFVDVEGLVLYPIFDKPVERVSQWESLIADMTSREMESGLVRLLVTLLQRMHAKLDKPPIAQLIEYVVSSADAWTFPVLAGEGLEKQEREAKNWDVYLATLDTAILGLVGEVDMAEDAIALALDEVLQSSLWARRLARRTEEIQSVLKAGLVARTKYIWARSDTVRRKGYFLAGIGLDAGHALDAASSVLNRLLVEANADLIVGNSEAAIEKVTGIAERVFTIPPFIPDRLPANWRELLRSWLLGLPMSHASQGDEPDTFQFIEGGLVYRLPWAMEAIRVRGIANGDVVGDMGLRLNDFDLTYAVPAVETGTVNRSASILIQAGFGSRLGALKAVTDTLAEFGSLRELRAWLTSEAVVQLAERPDWPTPETRELWISFAREFTPNVSSVWKLQRFWAWVSWDNDVAFPADLPVRVFYCGGQDMVLAADGQRLGTVKSPLNPSRRGLLRASVMDQANKILLSYYGPEDLWQPAA